MRGEEREVASTWDVGGGGGWLYGPLQRCVHTGRLEQGTKFGYLRFGRLRVQLGYAPNSGARSLEAATGRDCYMSE